MATHSAITLNEIQRFFAPQKIAVAGASRDPKKFGGSVIKELKEKGFDLYPVNPNALEIQGLKCFKSVTELPEDVKHLLIVTPKSSSSEVAGQAVEKKMEMVWIQQMSENQQAMQILQEAGIPMIHHKCIMMFANPVKGPHRFHRFLIKTFGKYPRLIKEEI